MSWDELDSEAFLDDAVPNPAMLPGHYPAAVAHLKKIPSAKMRAWEKASEESPPRSSLEPGALALSAVTDEDVPSLWFGKGECAALNRSLDSPSTRQEFLGFWFSLAALNMATGVSTNDHAVSAAARAHRLLRQLESTEGATCRT